MGGIGAIDNPVACIWPYKMATALFSKLITENRLCVQSNTNIDHGRE